MKSRRLPVSVLDCFAVIPAVVSALREGWSVRGIVGTLRGPARDDRGDVLSWCRYCDRAIWPGEELRTPLEPFRGGSGRICHIVCPHCLRGPCEDEGEEVSVA